MPRIRLLFLALVALVAGCAGHAAEARSSQGGRAPRVLPGISVLLRDSLRLIAGKRVGLLTNQTGVDERGVSDIDLLAKDPRVTAAGVRLVRLFSPEHGIRGTEDRQFIESGVDAKTGLPVYSLYTSTTIAPPDSTLRDIDVLVFDLQDIGTRTWTYVGNLVYALRATKRAGMRMIVVDRPNPIGGERHEGLMLDSALANPEENTAARPARPYALYPFPLRHGLTMGEMAAFYNERLGIGADLHVIPMIGWQRHMWFDETGLPWVKPSPNMPSLASATLYPVLVPFEGSNLSVGRGTDEPFQRFGAPWLRARDIAAALNDRGLAGVRFSAEEFTPRSPTDSKFADRRVQGVRIEIVDRQRVHAGRIGAAILWAVAKVNGDSLRISELAFDLRFGNRASREAIVRGEDPDAVIDAQLPAVVAFERIARTFYLYR
jgi:uncharacterized protein YbbC (DUF1343 family)